MQKLTERWFLLALLLVWLSTPVAAQIQIPQPVRPATVEIDGVLQRAQQLESEQRWGEALSIYEEALRDFPQHATLGDRHNLAKIHYDLGRRYSDSSFIRALSTVDDRQALNMYNEVLVKIETHYVTVPNWQELVARGTQDLQVALAREAVPRAASYG